MDYAVYQPGTYTGDVQSPSSQVPGQAVSFPDDHYVYAYQFFNSAESDVVIDYFSVGLLSNAYADNVGFDLLQPGIAPSDQFIMPGNILCLFNSPEGSVGSDEYSTVLLFSSDAGPEMGFGSIPGGATGGVSGICLPTPVPEPATVSLLLGGSIIFVCGKKSARKRRID